jgi:hypothetical protein
MLCTDLFAVDLEQNRSLKKGYRKNEPQTLLEAHDDPLNTRQWALADSYLLAYLKKWKRLNREPSLNGRLQRNDFRLR